MATPLSSASITESTSGLYILSKCLKQGNLATFSASTALANMLRLRVSSATARPVECRTFAVAPRPLRVQRQAARTVAKFSVDAEPTVEESLYDARFDELIPNVQGLVHSTESMSAVDGPGLRCVIFTQGCGMRCHFCSNPDTQAMNGTAQRISSKDIGKRLSRLVPYLKHQNGGVTCSGGEPLLQPEFVSSIFQEAHALGLTTCLDTTGQGTKEHNWNKVLPHTDLVLFCVKHLDPVKYHEITGLHQQGALKFAEELKARQIPFWLRYVLVPGYTDAPEDIERLIQFAKQQSSMLGVELLPYHSLGKHKYEALGWKYPLEGVKTPSDSDVRVVIHKLEDAGINVRCDVKTTTRVEDTHHLIMPHS